MTGDVTEVASEVTCSTGNQVLVVGVEVVGTGSDDTYDYNQSTIKICIKQTIIYVDVGWGWGWGCRSMTRHGPIVMYFSGLNTQMHHSWEHLGILSPWDFVPLGFCPPWILSAGFLSSLDFGYCPMGFCPVGFCPRTVFNMFECAGHHWPYHRPTMCTVCVDLLGQLPSAWIAMLGEATSGAESRILGLHHLIASHDA